MYERLARRLHSNLLKKSKVLNPDRWLIFLCLSLALFWKHGEGDFFMQKNTITKWLIQFDSNKELQIIEKEVSKYAPINRILDRVGFFELELIDVSGKKYFATYEPEEKYVKKTKILLTRIDSEANRAVDMDKTDLENIPEIARLLMGFNSVDNYTN